MHVNSVSPDQCLHSPTCFQLTSVFIVIVSHSQAKWNSAEEADQSETAVFIEPPEGAVTRVRLH